LGQVACLLYTGIHWLDPHVCSGIPLNTLSLVHCASQEQDDRLFMKYRDHHVFTVHRKNEPSYNSFIHSGYFYSSSSSPLREPIQRRFRPRKARNQPLSHHAPQIINNCILGIGLHNCHSLLFFVACSDFLYIYVVQQVFEHCEYCNNNTRLIDWLIALFCCLVWLQRSSLKWQLASYMYLSDDVEKALLWVTRPAERSKKWKRELPLGPSGLWNRCKHSNGLQFYKVLAPVLNRPLLI